MNKSAPFGPDDEVACATLQTHPHCCVRVRVRVRVHLLNMCDLANYWVHHCPPQIELFSDTSIGNSSDTAF